MEETTKYKILIDLIFYKKRKYFNREKSLVQNKPYQFSFKIKNIGHEVTPEMKLKNLSLSSCDKMYNLYQPFDDEMLIPTINPNQEVIIQWPDILVPHMKGQAWINLDIKDQPENTTFETYHLDKYSGKVEKNNLNNHWQMSTSIRGELEQRQATTNILILILTLLVFLDSTLGINTIIKSIIQGVSWILLSVGYMLIRIN